jgi:ssRNA-specific RNase YbeY (16S rRNA maturation enzyme)
MNFTKDKTEILEIIKRINDKEIEPVVFTSLNEDDDGEYELEIVYHDRETMESVRMCVDLLTDRVTLIMGFPAETTPKE